MGLVWSTASEAADIGKDQRRTDGRNGIQRTANPRMSVRVRHCSQTKQPPMADKKYKQKVITCFVKDQAEADNITDLLEQADKLLEAKYNRPVYRTETVVLALESLIELLKAE